MTAVPDYRPRFPEGYRPAIGIVGCGGIVRLAHLPAYRKSGLDVAGVYDIAPDARRRVASEFGVRAFRSLDRLLADPGIEIVDVATGPVERPQLIRRALAAG